MQTKPNVILFFVDDLGYGDISSFNEEGKLNTKHIDYLSANGMRFTDSHASSPLCSPSRYGLMTGRYNFRSKIKRTVLTGDSNALIEKERMTLAQLFHKNGYKTACVGKWHLGMEWETKANPHPSDYPCEINPADYDTIPERAPFVPLNDVFAERTEGLDIDYTKPIVHGPLQYGFDYFFGMVASWDQPPFAYIENDRMTAPLTHMTGIPHMNRATPGTEDQWQYGLTADGFDHEKVPDDMQEKVMDLLDTYAQGSDPFFLYYPMPTVHTPLLPNAHFRGKSGLGPYGDLVLQTDDMVGQVVEKLQANNMLDDTIIIFTSDNGCSRVVDYEALIAKGHNPSYHFRGAKGSMYEAGHRVPTVVHYPAKIKAGTVCEQTVCHTDFFRTFADMLGETLADNVAEDSFSNLPLWYGEDGFARTSTVCNTATGYLGLSKDDYKLLCCSNGGAKVKTPDGMKTDETFELYNLKEDIGEQNDLFKTAPDVAEALRQELCQLFDDGRSTQGVKQENDPPAHGDWPEINFK